MYYCTVWENLVKIEGFCSQCIWLASDPLPGCDAGVGGPHFQEQGSLTFFVVQTLNGGGAVGMGEGQHVSQRETLAG